MIRENGRFPLTQPDLERLVIYTNLVGTERLVAWEEEKGMDRALFVVVRNAGQIPVLAICSKCPCGDGEWIGRVIGTSDPHRDVLHISGETCGSEGFNRKATRYPLVLLTDEQRHKLADTYPNNQDVARMFLAMTA
jgi:hypothetical protein